MAKGFNGYETWHKANRYVVPFQGKLQEEKIKTSGSELWKNSERVKLDHLCLTQSLIEI